MKECRKDRSFFLKEEIEVFCAGPRKVDKKNLSWLHSSFIHAFNKTL